MSLDPLVVQELYRTGDMRPTGEWIICAARGCERPAAHDIVHKPDDGQRFYVPLCEPHIEACPHEVIEYEIVSYGFVGTDDSGSSKADL